MKVGSSSWFAPGLYYVNSCTSFVAETKSRRNLTL